MKRVLGVLFVSAAMALVAPQTASAHERGQQGRYSDWEDRDTNAYGRFYQELQHLDEGVEHALNDGSMDRRDARRFDRAIGSVQQQLAYYYNRQGYLNRWQVQDIQSRIEQLHIIMHDVHDDGHDAQDYRYDRYRRR